MQDFKKRNVMKAALSFLFAMLFVIALPNTSSARCDTLQLKEQPALLVEVDHLSTDMIRYRPCGQTGSGIRKVTWNQVADFRPGGASHGIMASDLNSLRKSGKKPETRNKWIFKHTTKRKEFVLFEGDRITVDHFEHGYELRSKGFLHTIDDSLLYVRNEYGYVFPVPRDKVLKIKRHRKGSNTGKAIGAMAIGLGALLTVFVILASIFLAAIFFSVFIFTAGSDSEEPKGPGCTLPILLILGGVGIFALSQPKAIRQPFSEQWNVRVEYPAGMMQEDTPVMPGLGAP
jgi:hypothetical protein